jgi:hypothetical protein
LGDQPGTEYTPQWMKIPNLESSNHPGIGLLSSDAYEVVWSGSFSVWVDSRMIANRISFMLRCFLIGVKNIQVAALKNISILHDRVLIVYI